MRLSMNGPGTASPADVGEQAATSSPRERTGADRIAIDRRPPLGRARTGHEADRVIRSIPIALIGTACAVRPRADRPGARAVPRPLGVEGGPAGPQEPPDRQGPRIVARSTASPGGWTMKPEDISRHIESIRDRLRGWEQ